MTASPCAVRSPPVQSTFKNPPQRANPDANAMAAMAVSTVSMAGLNISLLVY